MCCNIFMTGCDAMLADSFARDAVYWDVTPRSLVGVELTYAQKTEAIYISETLWIT
jgi:hypothetical protein